MHIADCDPWDWLLNLTWLLDRDFLWDLVTLIALLLLLCGITPLSSRSMPCCHPQLPAHLLSARKACDFRSSRLSILHVYIHLLCLLRLENPKKEQTREMQPVAGTEVLWGLWDCRAPANRKLFPCRLWSPLCSRNTSVVWDFNSQQIANF